MNLLAERGIPLIEDDVYSELYFGRDRPRISKVRDAHGLVLDCGSFAKRTESASSLPGELITAQCAGAGHAPC